MNTIKKVAIFSLVLTIVGVLNGCSTLRGFGQDVSRTGHDIQQVAS